MVDIKISTKKVKFTVPIPYSMLSLCVSVVSSNLITRLIERQNKRYLNESETTFTYPPLDKKLLKQIIQELKQHKGTEIVYIKAKDNSEITITL